MCWNFVVDYLPITAGAEALVIILKKANQKGKEKSGRKSRRGRLYFDWERQVRQEREELKISPTERRHREQDIREKGQKKKRDDAEIHPL